MRHKYGDHKVDHWLKENALTWKPDALTGSEAKEVREYQVPRVFSRNEQKSADQLTCNSEKDFDDKDLDRFKELKVAGTGKIDLDSSSSTSSSSSEAGTPVKKQKRQSLL